MVRWGSLKGGVEEREAGGADGQKEDGSETLERQEGRLRDLYVQGMHLMVEERFSEATESFLRALADVALNRDVTADHRFNDLRRIKYLCLKNLAGVAERLQREEAALEWLGQAIALDGSDISTWCWLGTTAQNLGRLHVARCAFERGLVLRPRHAMCLERLCEVTYSVGDLAACISAASTLLAVEPANTRAMFLKGLCLTHSARTRIEGEDIMDQAREAGHPDGDEDRLQELRAKRRRLAEPDPEPRELLLEAPSWRCLLERTLATYNEAVADVLKTGSALNLPVVVRLAAPRVEEEGAGGALMDVDDTATRDCDPEDEGGGGLRKVFEDNDALCVSCGGDDEDGDELLLCNTYELCGYAIHRTCHDPPLSKVPEGDWSCPGCASKGGAGPARALGDAPKVLGGEGAGESRDGMPGASSPKKRKSRAGDVERKDGERKSLRAQEARPLSSEAFSKFLQPLAACEEAVRREAAEGNALLSEERQLAMQQEAERERREQEEENKAKDAPAQEGGEGAAEQPEEVPSGDLTRFQMLARVAPAEPGEEEGLVGEFVAGLPSPCGLLELVRAVLQRLPRVAAARRMRGKTLEMLLQLDKATQSFFALDEEAALGLAELHYDAYELAGLQEKLLAELRADREPDAEADGGEGAAARPERQAAWHTRHLGRLSLAALETHSSRVRLGWLQARRLHADKGLAQAAQAYEWVRRTVAEGPEGERAVVVLPSCLTGNCVTAPAVEACLAGPKQALENVSSGDKLDELAKQLKDTAPGSAEQAAAEAAYAGALRQALIPEVDAEGRFLVTALVLPADAKATKAVRDERDERLIRLHMSRLAAGDGLRDALYVLNLFLAEAVGLEGPAGELGDREEGVLFQALDTDGSKRAQQAVQLVASFLAEKGGELAALEAPFPLMLQQLQVQLSRLLCRVGSTRGVTQLFYQACVVFYQLHTALAPGLTAQEKQEVLSGIFEELLKRNVHNLNNGEFLRGYLQVLTELRTVAQGDEGEAPAAEDKGDDDDDDDSDLDSEEGEDDKIERELARCYYVMFDLRINGFKELYQETDALLAKDEDGLKTPGKGRDARNKPIPLADPALCLDVFDFVRPRIAKALDKQRNVSSSFKEVLETIVGVFPEPPPTVAAARGLVTGFLADNLRPDADLPSFVSRIMDWLHNVPSLPWPAEGAGAAAAAPGGTGEGGGEQAGGGAGEVDESGSSSDVVCLDDEPKPEGQPPAEGAPPHAEPTAAPQQPSTAAGAAAGQGAGAAPAGGGAVDLTMDDSVDASALQQQQQQQAGGGAAQGGGGPADGGAMDPRLLTLYENVYSMLARCHQKSGQQSSNERAEKPFLMDLWIHPRRLSSWLGLAQCYSSFLHADGTYGIRCISTIEHSHDARRMLFRTLRACWAAAELDPHCTAARGGLGTCLYLLLQSRKKEVGSDVQMRRASNMAYQEFSKALAVEDDWRTRYFLGKLAKKIGKPEEECLEHLYLAARQCGSGGALGLEAFYKLHATRAKLLEYYDGFELLSKYSVEACMARLLEEQKEDDGEEDRLGGSKVSWINLPEAALNDAKEEQARYEEAVGGLSVSAKGAGGEGGAEGVLRDCMIALRAAGIKNKSQKFHWARGRYRLAKMMADSAPAGRDADVSKEIVATLRTLFFSEKDPPQASVQYFDDKFMQFKVKEAEQATFSNASSYTRLRTKAVKLFSEHLAKQPGKDSAERLEKLLELLAKTDKPARNKDPKDKRRSATSLVKAVHCVVGDLFQLLQEMLTGEPQGNEAEAAAEVFKRAGKLWLTLSKMLGDDKDYLDGLKLGLHEKLFGDRPPTAAPLQVTLAQVHDSLCPIGALVSASYAAFSASRPAQSTPPCDGRNINQIVKTAWQDAFGEKKMRLSLSDSKAMRGVQSPSTPRTPTATNSPPVSRAPSAAPATILAAGAFTNPAQARGEQDAAHAPAPELAEQAQSDAAVQAARPRGLGAFAPAPAAARAPEDSAAQGGQAGSGQAPEAPVPGAGAPPPT